MGLLLIPGTAAFMLVVGLLATIGPAATRIVTCGRPVRLIAETKGQLLYEWEHPAWKLRRRSPAWYRDQVAGAQPTPHPLFRIVAGGVRDWERVK